MLAAISEPTPYAGKPPSTVTNLYCHTKERITRRQYALFWPVRRKSEVEKERFVKTHRLVFLTLLTIDSKSIGLIDLKLMTSTVTPSSFSRISAASTQCPTDLECATSVMSFPSRSILAFPMGRRKSSDVAHSLETGKDWP